MRNFVTLSRKTQSVLHFLSIFKSQFLGEVFIDLPQAKRASESNRRTSTAASMCQKLDVDLTPLQLETLLGGQNYLNVIWGDFRALKGLSRAASQL